MKGFERTFICFYLFSNSLIAPYASGATSSNTIKAEEIFLVEGHAWELSSPAWIQRYESEGFRWTSDQRRTARAYKQALSIFGHRVWEALVRFEEDQPTGVMLYVYNRGDSGELSKSAFAKLLKDLELKLTKWAQAQPKATDNQLVSIGVKRWGKAWQKGKLHTALIASYSTKDRTGRFVFRPEYVRLEIKPSRLVAQTPIRAYDAVARQKAKTVSLSALREKVVREEDGSVLIGDFYMVDQGHKGYCAVASAARTMMYYGFEVDQHELAQLSASSASLGTNLETMVKALKRVGAKLGYKVRRLEEVEYRDLQRTIKRYNGLARRKQKAEVRIGYASSYEQLYARMDPELLSQARQKSKGDFEKFQRNVISHVDRGIPLVWGVITGKVTENPPVRSVGGHLRSIIGYNKGRSQIIYSDSWGKGHERKTLSLSDAWAITTGLYAIEPRWTSR